MTRRRRVSRREASEKRGALRRKNRIALQENEIARGVECQKLLRQKKLIIDEAFVSTVFRAAEGRDPHSLPTHFHVLTWHLSYYDRKRDREKFEHLLIEIIRRAPKLMREDYIPLVAKLREGLWIRPIDEWTPHGRSPRSIFISLVDHLFVQYPVPRFLYESLFNNYEPASALRVDSLFQVAAKGGSPYRYLREYKRVPVTRRMCHLFMGTPAGIPIIVGLRRAQVEVLGGERRLADRICRSFLGRELQPDEAFWQSVIHWLCNHWTDDARKVGPLLDYIKHRWEEDRSFSMKARSSNALIQGMEEWHRDLARLQALEKYVFKPSGFSGASYEMKKRVGVRGVEIWTIEEVLTSKGLIAEGRKMKHCVASYADWIKEGRSSIWSVKKDDERRLTIEIDNKNRRIAQVAGPCNESANGKEKAVVRSWAKENNIRIMRDAWW